MSVQSLFVYGSLSSGMVHFNKISSYIVSRETGYIEAIAYRLPSGYPVLVLEPNASTDQVPGEIIKVHAPDLVFRLLDEYHGFNPMMIEKSLFIKSEVSAVLATGEVERVFTYVMNKTKLPKTAQHLPNGNWLQNMKENPPLMSHLTDRQAEYIRKLSQSSGRDIVPIDLDLYRELMKLDLIVDKGRRLALSKLGKEVARYLPET